MSTLGVISGPKRKRLGTKLGIAGLNVQGRRDFHWLALHGFERETAASSTGQRFRIGLKRSWLYTLLLLVRAWLLATSHSTVTKRCWNELYVNRPKPRDIWEVHLRVRVSGTTTSLKRSNFARLEFTGNRSGSPQVVFPDEFFCFMMNENVRDQIEVCPVTESKFEGPQNLKT